MSKPKLQPRKSEPPSVGIPLPPTARKSSSPAVNAQTAGAVPRFYDGPTVPHRADLKNQAKVAASKATAVAKTSSRRAAATARRHPWSILSIITTLPVLIFFSLASTVLCPPPGPPSALNRYVLSPLGYQPHQSHPILCYPANVYHREFLEPYVYPFIGDAHKRVTTSPAYINYVEPARLQVQSASQKAWNGPLKPIVNRTVRGARRFYLTFVQPHIPYLRAKVYGLTAPYTSRISAFASPHIATANAYATSASDRAVKGYKYAATHPLTGMASGYAQKGYKVGSEQSHKAYQWSKPHALRFRLEVERIIKEVLAPRAVKDLRSAAVQIAKVQAIARAQITQLYLAHLEPHVGPYVNKAAALIAPYTAMYHKHVYQPYIQPTVHYYFPPSQQPRSFLTMLSDFLPSGSSSSHAAERKGQMDDYYHDINRAQRPADVKVPQANKVAEKKAASPAKEATKERQEKRKIERSEMERVRDAIKTRVDEQGKAGLKAARSEIKDLHDDFTSNQLPILAQNLRSELDREIEYITRGLDKLYTTSTSLTKDQVQKSGEQGDMRLKRTTEKIRIRLDSVKSRIHEDGKKVVAKHSEAIDQALGKEYEQLGEQMHWIDGLTAKDGDRYNEVKKLADSWKAKYAALQEDPALTKPFSELRTEVNDYHGAFRDRLGILKRTAIDRIQAREAISSEAEPSRVSILPVKEAAGAAAAAVAGVDANGLIGKGKEQVMDALSQAQAVVQGQTASSGIVDQAKASAESIISAASSGVHVATRSAVKAVGGTPSPESPIEHAESIYNAATDAAGSAAVVASEAVHQATRSIMSAVGATPSPETYNESLESLLAVASEAVSGVIPDLSASAVMHDATRAAMRAVGATPSPETPGEHFQSMSHVASDAAASAVAAANEAIAGLAEDASRILHHATRSAYSAVGATPSPEGASEQLESVASVVAQGAASVYGAVGDSAASAYDAAGSQVHDATRSAMKAVGATPSPETPGEHAQSLAAAAASAVHDATRSAMKAVGVTPSPESPAEYASSAYEAASSGAVSIGSVVSEDLASLATRIQEALGLVPTPEPLASSASSYLASLASAGSSAGAEALSSGSSLLASLQTEAASTLHSATRAASRAAGATPSPETPGEYAQAAGDYIKDKAEQAVRHPREIAESLVRKHAAQISRDLESERAAGTTRIIGDDGHGHGHGRAHATRGAHAHPAQDEL
ncbi:hypothetical protein IAU60_006375 [Kwoniella sp. DSM 27419]